MPVLSTQQRDTWLQLSPPWLSHDNGEKFGYVMGLMSDLLLEKMNQAVKIRVPGAGHPSQIPYLAEDRLLVQGPNEPDANFILRLQGAFPAWKLAGSRRAVLQQVQAFMQNSQAGVAASLPEMLIVGGNGTYSTWDTLTNGDALGAIPAKATVTPANWNWDGHDNAKYFRSWLVLFMHLVATGQNGITATVSSTGGSGVSGVTSGFATITGLNSLKTSNVQQWLTLVNPTSSGNRGTFQIQTVLNDTSCIIANPNAVAPDASNGSIHWTIGQYPFLRPAPVWGSPNFVWGQWSWGLAGTLSAIESIRGILRQWKSSGTYYPHIIVSFGGGDATAGNEFSPNSSQGSGNPDGTWGDYGKNVNGVWVTSKATVSPFTAFCDGTGQYFQCTVHNRT